MAALERYLAESSAIPQRPTEQVPISIPPSFLDMPERSLDSIKRKSDFVHSDESTGSKALRMVPIFMNKLSSQQSYIASLEDTFLEKDRMIKSLLAESQSEQRNREETIGKIQVEVTKLEKEKQVEIAARIKAGMMVTEKDQMVAQLRGRIEYFEKRVVGETSASDMERKRDW